MVRVLTALVLGAALTFAGFAASGCSKEEGGPEKIGREGTDDAAKQAAEQAADKGEDAAQAAEESTGQ